MVNPRKTTIATSVEPHAKILACRFVMLGSSSDVDAGPKPDDHDGRVKRGTQHQREHDIADDFKRHVELPDVHAGPSLLATRNRVTYSPTLNDAQSILNPPFEKEGDFFDRRR